MLVAWGKNSCGQCCTGDDQNISECEKRPRVVNTMLRPSIGSQTSILAVASGEAHTLFLTEYGDVFACGRAREGQLGIDLHSCDYQLRHPAMVTALRSMYIVQIAAGCKHSLALSRDGRVFEWGLLFDMGAENESEVWVSKRQGLGQNVEDLNARQRRILAESWNLYLKNGFDDDDCADSDILESPAFKEQRRRPVLTPRAAPGLENMLVRNVVCGFAHSVVAVADGQLFASGYNEKGQLGSGTRLASVQYSRVALPDGVLAAAGRSRVSESTMARTTTLDCGLNHTAAVAEQDGRLLTWGLGTFGQLGLGHDRKESCLPGIVEGLGAAVLHVACGDHHTLVSTADGNLFAFGHRDAIGGDSHVMRKPELQKKLGLRVGRPVQQIFAGGMGCFATVAIDGPDALPTLHSWGYNQHAQLGRGLHELECMHPGPVALPRVSGAKLCGVSASSYHCVALLEMPSKAVLPPDLGELPAPNTLLLGALRGSTVYDVTVTTSDAESLGAHRCILRARCPALAARLCESPAGSSRPWHLCLKGHSKACVSVLLEYLYCDFCIAGADVASELRPISEDLGLDRLSAGIRSAVETEGSGGLRWVRSAQGKWVQTEAAETQVEAASTYKQDLAVLVLEEGVPAEDVDYVELAIFQVNGSTRRSVHVARSVLLAVEFFRALLEGGFAEGTATHAVEVAADDVEAFVLCLRMLMTGDFALMPTDLAAVMALLVEAHRLGLPDLVSRAELKLGRLAAEGQIEGEEVINAVLYTAELYDLSKLASELRTGGHGDLH
eukprot:gnl/TRDRNA2_/TRDRNA2_185435_c0_seq1.p1 gnl/TRDRNA2_/TRDRNA2_185435_c0~~gnl/TRDRNA2_/TRDRNA2_185435_c0_seq1.p1  ORF type:complete len:782 (+),score=124.76 gnl/TRDRNA2_/TRDRNA2_185435_c0_seq1:108-2453(+)